MTEAPSSLGLLGRTPERHRLADMLQSARAGRGTALVIQGEAGAAFALNKSDVGFDKSAAFIWAPQVGYQFNIGGNNYIDAGVRYQGSTDFVSGNSNSQVNFVGLRVAYGF